MNSRRLVSYRQQEIPKLEFDFPVSGKSIFSDDVWDFSDNRLERLNSVSDSKLKINWLLLEHFANCNSIISLKLLIGLRINGIGARYSKGNLKPNTVCLTARNLIELLISISKYFCFIGSLDVVRIDIFNLEAIDIQNGLDRYERKSLAGVRPLLFLMTNVSFQKELQRLSNIGQSLKFTEIDIRNLNFPIREERLEKTSRAIPLQDDLLQFLIKTATGDLLTFLRRLGVQPTIDTSVSSSSTLRIPASLNIKECFSDYKIIRQAEIDNMKKKLMRGSYATKFRKKFRGDHQISPGEFKILIERVQSAARYLILQFTGVRYSEAISFKNGAIVKKGDDYYVKGIVVKGKSHLLRQSDDYWVAVPIVRDSIKLLELITEYTQHSFLFATNNSKVLDVKPRQLTGGGMNDMLNNYLYDIDCSGKYSDRSNNKKANRFYLIKPEFKICTHRIRHTLSNQFYRHESGLLVAAYHFKHVYMAIKMYNIPNEVTEGYGNIGNEIFSNAQRLQENKAEIVNSICHPDAPIAGGGATEFKKNRTDFFAGEIKRGKTIDTILKDLQKRNLPFADVMLGFCGGKNNYLDEQGREKSPPCIGQCKCNPAGCSNAIVPKIKKPLWESYLTSNQKLLKDPGMAHARDYLEYHIAEAEKVLKILNNENS